jgi:hypothetical protein
MGLGYGKMDAPQSMGIATRPPLPARVWRALMTLESSSKLAMVCVAFGWFFMNTLAVSLGSLDHGVRFFEMSAVIADPTRLFFGGDTPVHHALFALVCLACLAAPAAAHLTRTRTGWLGHLAPLSLMLTCGALLYWRTSGELLAAPDDAASLQGSLMHLANDLVHRGTDLVSRHVSIAAGSYLAMIGCVVLAVQGIRRFTRPDAFP